MPLCPLDYAIGWYAKRWGTGLLVEGDVMPISVQCPGCGGKFRAPDEAAGKRAKCPKCSAVIEVGSTQQQQSAQTSGVEKGEPPTPPAIPIKPTVPCEKIEKASGVLLWALVGGGAITVLLMVGLTWLFISHKPPPNKSPAAIAQGSTSISEADQEKGLRQAEDRVEVKQVIFAQNFLQGHVTIKPKSNGTFVWVEIVIDQFSQLPTTLDLTAVKLRDAKGAKQNVLGFGLGKRIDDKPAIDYFLGAPNSVVASGPYAADLFRSATIEGPNVGKVKVETDVPNKKATLTFHKLPSIIGLLFAAPEDPRGMTLTNVFGKSLKLQGSGGK